MKQKILIILFALPLFLLNPALSQSKEVLQTILTNQWVMKYKKLKTDLENKAAYVKNMDKISERDLTKMKKSYNATNVLLDDWIEHLAVSIQNGSDLEQLAHGGISEDLKKELEIIFSFYANDFSTKFEELTGQEASFVIGAPGNDNEADPANGTGLQPTEKNIDREFLTAKVKKMLVPSDWNSIN